MIDHTRVSVRLLFASTFSVILRQEQDNFQRNDQVHFVLVQPFSCSFIVPAN